MISEIDELKSFLSEVQVRLDELDERLIKTENVTDQSTGTLAAIDRRLSKAEKKLNEIASIKIYRDIIHKDLKGLSKDIKELKKDLVDVTSQSRKNHKELKAFTKFLRFIFQKKGIYLSKKSSLTKICSTLISYYQLPIKQSTEGIYEI